MSFADMIREHQVRCPWCLERKTWALDGVCKARDCRSRAERYKIRREGTVAPSRGSMADRPAPGPGVSPRVSVDACAGEAGAAFVSDGERPGAPVNARVSSLGNDLSPSGLDRG